MQFFLNRPVTHGLVARGAGRRTGRPRHLLVGVCLILGACQTYKAAPMEPTQILEDLERVGLTMDGAGGESGDEAGENPAFSPEDGISMMEAAAFAVAHNPALLQLRAENGIAASQLIEAGLLPNPTAGWNAVDWIVHGTKDDVLTGFGFMWDMPRPGEIKTKKRIAKARIEEVRAQVLAGEWNLSRSVALAWLEVLAAGHRLELNEQILNISRRTHDFLLRSRDAKTATALQENLAAVQLANLEADRRQLVAAERLARQVLNGLLGLRPEFKVELQADNDTFMFEDLDTEPDAVVLSAVRNRPDLLALLAVYRQSEERLRLEIKRQWPSISIGSGINLELPIFNNFNAPAVRTAMRERERVGLQVTAAVHELRQEVHRTTMQMTLSANQIRYLLENLSPRLAESLRITREARAVTQITPLELLTAQRQVLESKTRLLELRINHRKSRELVSTLDGSWGRPTTVPAEETTK